MNLSQAKEILSDVGVDVFGSGDNCVVKNFVVRENAVLAAALAIAARRGCVAGIVDGLITGGCRIG